MWLIEKPLTYKFMRAKRPYHVIHSVASLPYCHGVVKDLLDWCLSENPQIPQPYLKSQSVEVKIAKNAIFSCSDWLFALCWLICAHNAPLPPLRVKNDSPSKTFGSSVAGVV